MEKDILHCLLQRNWQKHFMQVIQCTADRNHLYITEMQDINECAKHWQRGEKLPFDPTDATIYYVGPTPAKPGQVIGSAGPTTSGRMDAYAPDYDVCWSKRYDRKRCPSSGSCGCNEEILTVFTLEPSAVQVHFLPDVSRRQN